MVSNSTEKSDKKDILVENNDKEQSFDENGIILNYGTNGEMKRPFMDWSTLSSTANIASASKHRSGMIYKKRALYPLWW